jgi:hypothetical protein
MFEALLNKGSKYNMGIAPKKCIEQLVCETENAIRQLLRMDIKDLYVNIPINYALNIAHKFLTNKNTLQETSCQS